MASVTLYGGCSYCNLLLKENNGTTLSDEDKSVLTTSPFNGYEWDKNTVMNAPFSSDLSGSNFAGGFQNISRFKIYKKLGNQPKFHKIYDSDNVNMRVVEDYIVGDKCSYEYYIYPVCEDSNGSEVVSSPIKTDSISLNSGRVRIIGLIQDEEDSSVYSIDLNNVWGLDLNLTNEGFTSNTKKTFSDTLHAYQKETHGNGNYRTFSLQGLLGKYDCFSSEYIDTYDDIIEWENFINSNQLKVIIDLRGIITPGDIESNSFTYELNGKIVSVNFNFRQLDDLEHMTILAEPCITNPIYNSFLADVNGLYLQSDEDTSDTKNLTYLTAFNEVVK